VNSAQEMEVRMHDAK